MAYQDRQDAGVALAGCLTRYAGRSDVLVLGLLRGGLPVAAAVAGRLGVPFDALVVRKLGVPWAPEVAFGAVGPGGVRVLNKEVADHLGPDTVAAVGQREAAELARLETRYRAGRPPLDLTGRVALIVDDGLATGATARVAVEVARTLHAARVAVAVPVGSPEAVEHLARIADEVVCPLQPPDFGAVSRFYRNFAQISDAQVMRLLNSCGSA